MLYRKLTLCCRWQWLYAIPMNQQLRIHEAHATACQQGPIFYGQQGIWIVRDEKR